MRRALAVLMALVYAGVFVVPWGFDLDLESLLRALRDPGHDGASCGRGWQQGLEAADRDIARGTPWIRRHLDGDGDLESDGVGIHRGTGLPLSNTSLTCSTWVDLAAYDAANMVYNERILAAYADGSLKDLSLSHKVRTKTEIRALLETPCPTMLARDGDTLSAADGKYQLAYCKTIWRDGSQTHEIALTRPGRGTEMLRAAYPRRYVDRPEALWPTRPRGPFEGVVVDDETTAILRDLDGYAWVIDLPRGIVVQVAGPIE